MAPFYRESRTDFISETSLIGSEAAAIEKPISASAAAHGVVNSTFGGSASVQRAFHWRFRCLAAHCCLSAGPLRRRSRSCGPAVQDAKGAGIDILVETASVSPVVRRGAIRTERRLSAVIGVIP